MSLSQSAASTIDDQSVAMNVRNASHVLTAALLELRTAAQKTHRTGSASEIDSALEQVGASEIKIIKSYMWCRYIKSLSIIYTGDVYPIFVWL